MYPLRTVDAKGANFTSVVRIAWAANGVDEVRGSGRGPRTETESFRGAISRKEEPVTEEMRPVRKKILRISSGGLDDCFGFTAPDDDEDRKTGGVVPCEGGLFRRLSGALAAIVNE